MTELTENWQKIATKSGTWRGSSASMTITVELYARYDPSNRGAARTRIQAYAKMVHPTNFTGTWCYYGGHYIGCNRQGGWTWDPEGTRVCDHDSTWYMPDGGPDNPEYYWLDCDNGAWSGELGTYWIYGYYNMTEDNTKVVTAVSLPSLAVAPADPTISNVSASTNSISFRMNESSWGDPNSGRFEYYWGTTSGTTDNYTIVPSSGYTTDTYRDATLSPLTANTRYYVRLRTWNQALNNPSGLIQSGYVTTAPVLTSATATNIEPKSATISVNTAADGGFYTKTIEYSLDGQTWLTGATVASGEASSASFSLTNLSPVTSYTVQLRVSTTAGVTNCDPVSFSTKGTFYGSVDGASKATVAMYGSVLGETKRIVKFYGSEDGVTKRIM